MPVFSVITSDDLKSMRFSAAAWVLSLQVVAALLGVAWMFSFDILGGDPRELISWHSLLLVGSGLAWLGMPVVVVVDWWRH